MAAHCCYVLAEISLQMPEAAWPPRLLLLGHDHSGVQPPSHQAIQASEIYAYFRNRSLASQPDFVRNLEFVTTSLPPYQLYYAHQLCDMGLLEQVRHTHSAPFSYFGADSFFPGFQAAAYVRVVFDSLSAPGVSWNAACSAQAEDLASRLRARGCVGVDNHQDAPMHGTFAADMAPTPCGISPCFLFRSDFW